jgi:hypothetical protein
MSDSTSVQKPTTVEPVRQHFDTELDSFLMSALTIYDVMKAVPHPYNAVATMSCSWAHDFANFAFRVKSVLIREQVRAETAEAERDEALKRIADAPHPDDCGWWSINHVLGTRADCNCWKSQK